MIKVAQASRHSLFYAPETGAGLAPASAPMRALRNTSCSLNLKRDSFTSEEKRSDRQISDVRSGTNQIGGDIGFEPCFGEYDALLEACLAGTWSGDELKCGTEERSFTFERAFADIGQYVRYRGCFINTLSLSLKPNAMASGAFGIIGLDAETAEAPLSASPAPSSMPFQAILDQESGTNMIIRRKASGASGGGAGSEGGGNETGAEGGGSEGGGEGGGL